MARLYLRFDVVAYVFHAILSHDGRGFENIEEV